MNVLSKIKAVAKGKVELHKQGWSIASRIGRGEIREEYLGEEDKQILSATRKDTATAIGLAVGTAIISSILD